MVNPHIFAHWEDKQIRVVVRLPVAQQQTRENAEQLFCALKPPGRLSKFSGLQYIIDFLSHQTYHISLINFALLS